MADPNIPESSEESKARHTPGPYWYDTDPDATMIRCRMLGVAMPCEGMNDRQILELVALLNKGTHFDEMLEALKEIVGACVEREDTAEYMLISVQDFAEAAIAKAEGTDD